MAARVGADPVRPRTLRPPRVRLQDGDAFSLLRPPPRRVLPRAAVPAAARPGLDSRRPTPRHGSRSAPRGLLASWQDEPVSALEEEFPHARTIRDGTSARARAGHPRRLRGRSGLATYVGPLRRPRRRGRRNECLASRHARALAPPLRGDPAIP